MYLINSMKQSSISSAQGHKWCIKILEDLNLPELPDNIKDVNFVSIQNSFPDFPGIARLPEEYQDM